ncbi:hypothetical protein JTB14_030185 [Gonioctena quinquepunctata]|nr:hypothetical protein JTB14_030185 [Gonioctena quinquepunctata]
MCVVAAVSSSHFVRFIKILRVKIGVEVWKRRELCQKLKMDRKKYYNLENPRDIQEVMDLIENEDLSDMELGVGSDEEDLQEYEVVPISRPGPDILTRHI